MALKLAPRKRVIARPAVQGLTEGDRNAETPDKYFRDRRGEKFGQPRKPGETTRPSSIPLQTVGSIGNVRPCECESVIFGEYRDELTRRMRRGYSSVRSHTFPGESTGQGEERKSGLPMCIRENLPR